MKKYLYIIALIICLLLSACGASQTSSAEEQNKASSASNPSFETDSITVYDIIMGESYVVTDGALISDLASSAQLESWKALTELGDQIGAEPDYILDFGNGTCIGRLGDGYILVGTAFEYLSEDHQSYRVVDGTQYQVPIAFTDMLQEITQ